MTLFTFPLKSAERGVPPTQALRQRRARGPEPSQRPPDTEPRLLAASTRKARIPGLGPHHTRGFSNSGVVRNSARFRI